MGALSVHEDGFGPGRERAPSVVADGDRGPQEPPGEVQTVRVDPGLGRDEEFTAFVDESRSALMRTAWLLCGDAHQAEELVQQALVKTYVAWPRAREREPLAYARRVLANQRISTWRRRRREVVVEPASMPDAGVPATEAVQAERDRLVRALAMLPARQRRVVVLRHLVGMTESEVAEDLGISVGTVKSTGSRALTRLRRELGAGEEPRGEVGAR
ncbi:SigE family RNA polymerase sigma factor [Actinotalea sp. M2MS4P-6]|uniref:SigE family RNA polymerase sigma factor n=1 Tax=Actinotalea sp. M2MS4P-6 TaxID=2983762 RepID=UPI0021E3D5E9|nr:SigE family RNA polymerase sigma factor [Actinotalea sp. M2MS4P-6]MCV2395437.1 SigE family RNA polymerase sigma factor [Actinotalea sp. M2MS4P-6]